VVEYIAPAKMFYFVIICSYLGGPHVAAQRPPGRAASPPT